MGIAFVTGGLGDGKSLYAMGKIRDYLSKRRKVATNYNLDLAKLCSPGNKHSRVIRVPDAPSISDLRCIGYGSDEPGGQNHGLLVLDELGTWFNARDFANKDRLKVLKYIIHLRKKRWDVIFIVQDFTMVDKQLRGNLTSQLITCRVSHNMFKPFKYFPKFHMAMIRSKERANLGSEFFRHRDLHGVYDTEQLFNARDDLEENDFDDADQSLVEREQYYAELDGLYCVLPPGYLGRSVQGEIEQRNRLGRKRMMRKGYQYAATIAGAVTIWSWVNNPQAVPSPPVEAVEAVTAKADTGGMFSQALGSFVNAQPVFASDVPAETGLAGMYGDLRIIGYSRFGDHSDYTFADSSGTIVRQRELELLGIDVKSRGRSNALLVAPDYQFLNVYQ